MKNSNKKIKQPVKNGIAKVPVVMQLEELECGAASLAMILAYYDKWIPLEQVRYSCGVSRNGSNAKNIVKAASKYNLIAKGYRYSVKDIMEKGIFPCIIHWEAKHFVVLNGFRKCKAVINDPAKGHIEISIEEFKKAFSGVCLMFSPGEDFVPEGKKKNMLQYAKFRLQGTKKIVAFVVITTLICSLIGIFESILSKVFLDRLLEGKNSKEFLPFIVALTILSVIQLVITWVQAIYTYRMEGKFAAEGNAEYMWKILRMPMEFFSQRRAGDLKQRQRANADIAKNLVNIFAPLFIQGFMMVFYLVIMIRYSPLLTMIGLIAVLLNLYVSFVISRKRINLTRVILRDRAVLAGTVVSGVDMIETIRATGAERGYFLKWKEQQIRLNEQKEKYARLESCLGYIPGLIIAIVDILILVLGAWLSMNGAFTVGMVMAFQGFFAEFSAPVQSMIQAGQKLQEMRSEMERIEDVMQYPVDINFTMSSEEKDCEYSKLRGYIELKNVTFGYSRLDKPLIENFNLILEPGKKVAIVGASGCGKSTVASLIAGLYHPWSGEILYDGKTIQEINRSVFSGSLAIVDQDIILFEDTIANNIKMWDSTIEDFEMILAARDAKIHDEIMRRSGGYQYSVAEGGKDFSGGQRQRMEIARVLAQDPTIMILDEATSALDARTENEVIRAIGDRGITCIIIAHRLSTIRDCDEIIVMRYGEVVERGKHEELYQKGGYYRELVTNE